MTTPATGPISLSDINTELGRSSTAKIDLGNQIVRGLIRNYGSSTGQTDLASSYNKTANSSQSINALTLPGCQGPLAIAANNNTAYIMGGYHNSTLFTYTSGRTVSTDTNLGNLYTMPVGRGLFGGTITPDKSTVIVCPSYMASGDTTIHKWTISTDTWTALPTTNRLVSPGAVLACAMIDSNRVLFVDNNLRSQVFNLSTNAWGLSTTTPASPFYYGYANFNTVASFNDGNRVGWTDGARLHIYYADTNTWITQVTPTGRPVDGTFIGAALTPLPGNRVMMVGGCTSTIAARLEAKKTWIFDGTSATWSRGPDLPDTFFGTNNYGIMYSGVCTFDNGAVLVAGGFDGSVSINRQCLLYPNYTKATLP